MAKFSYSSNYFQVVGKLNYFLALAVAFTMAFPPKVSNFFWTLWLISWVLEGRFFNKLNFKFDRSKYPILFLGGFYIFQLISLLWAESTNSGLTALQRQFSLIAVIPIALWGVNKYYKIKSLVFSLLAGIFVSMITYYITILYVSNYEYFLTGGMGQYWKEFSIEDFQNWSSLIKHRLYYCVVIVIGLISLFLIKDQLRNRYGNVVTILLFLAAVILMIGMVYLTGSRSTMLVLIFLLYVGIIRMLNKKYKILIIISTIILFVSSVILFFKFHPRMESFSMKDIETFETGKTDNPLIEPRILIWHAAIVNYKDYYLTGKGVGNGIDYLIEKYKSNNYPEVYSVSRYNPHNQYLNATIELGILGGIFLLLIFLFYFSFFSGKARIFALFYASLIGMSLFTEAMFGRVEGVLTICFFNLFCVWLQQDADNELKSKTEIEK